MGSIIPYKPSRNIFFFGQTKRNNKGADPNPNMEKPLKPTPLPTANHKHGLKMACIVCHGLTCGWFMAFDWTFGLQIWSSIWIQTMICSTMHIYIYINKRIWLRVIWLYLGAPESGDIESGGKSFTLRKAYIILRRQHHRNNHSILYIAPGR